MPKKRHFPKNEKLKPALDKWDKRANRKPLIKKKDYIIVPAKIKK
jgi:hypothetical protein